MLHCRLHQPDEQVALHGGAKKDPGRVEATNIGYSKEDVLHVVYRHYEADIPAASWKKHGITLQEILIYGGIPIISALPSKVCRHVTFMPGRRNSRILIRNAKRCHLMITLDGAIQDSNKISIQHTNVVEIHLSDQDILLITLPH